MSTRITPIWMNLYTPVPAARVTAQGPKGWIVGGGGEIFQYDDINYMWVQELTPSASPVNSISASTDGAVVASNALGNVYLWSYGSWSQIYVSSNAAVHVSAGDMNNIVVVDSTGAVIRNSFTINTPMASGPIKVSGTTGLGQIWGVGLNGAVYKYNGSTGNWDTVPGKNLVQIHVSLSSTNTIQIVGVDTLGKGWSYNMSSMTWTAIVVPNPGDKFAAIEAGAGFIWCLLNNGHVYRGFI